MKTGVVKMWRDDKGYGFITQEDGSEIFVHFSGIVGNGRRSLQPGQRVGYIIGIGRDGRPEAQKVIRLES
ncbi:MAG TPA: cold shock domain-containing protein [Anaerolineaceae bacterium]|nr:cold shock domain-containing protein [Anaerolineaceae bacterium]